MRAYTVTATLPAEKGADDTTGTPFLQYAGTQSDAATIKRETFDAYRNAGLKRGAIEVEEIEIPTDKKGLIAWLNDNIAAD